MFRGFMPVTTLVVFGIGTGIGLAWSQGLIPLALTPANTGKLGIEFTRREPLPPPPDEGQATRRPRPKAELPPTDPEVFESQAEPDENSPKVISAIASDDDEEASDTITLSGSADSTTDGPIINPQFKSANGQRPRLRARDQGAVQLDPQAGIEEVPASQAAPRVMAAVHQDPTGESDSDSTGGESIQSLRERLQAAEEKLASGETLPAHRELSKLYWNHKDFRPQVQELIDSTAKAIFFQPRPNYVEPYVIQEGDRLSTVARKYQLSWEYLAKLNRTDPKKVQIGQKLKVMKGPFGAVVDLRDFTLTVHLQGYYVKRYHVGIGKDNSSPIGKFEVLEKLENPQYTDSRTGKVIEGDDPANPLGERWIDLGDGYGIHGTIEPNSIGKAESRGCIRLRDDDIIEVYNFLVKGSEVVIRK